MGPAGQRGPCALARLSTMVNPALHRGRDCMDAELTTSCAIIADHH
jgi:hypothetical protein